MNVSDEIDIEFCLDVLTNFDEMMMPEAVAGDTFVKQTRKIHDRARPWTLARSNQGLGLGEKISGGVRTGELSLKVYVVRKKPLSKLANPVPKCIAMPDMGDVVTDVEEIGRVQAEQFTVRSRPAMPGCGLGHTNVEVGTFGALVRKKDDPVTLYILSNSHVLAASGTASPGDHVVQPGRKDGGRVTADTLATLAEFVPFDYAPMGYPNLVDAAIARVEDPARVSEIIRVLDQKPVGVSTTLRRDAKVQKVGRTTDLTTGVIKDVHYRARIPYLLPGGATKYARFQDIVLCSRYSAGGDSGSLVLNNRRRAVGLHFAGSVSTSIFCRIDNVLDILGLELL